MPRTKFQEIIYAILMTFFMVLAMEIYNAGLHMGGLTNQGILNALSEMPIMFPICFVTGFFFIDRIAPKIAFRLVTPGKDLPFLVTLTRAGVTVCLMCPTMSLWATLIFSHAGTEFPAIWLQTFASNFPMALCWQIFFCGPLVRFLFPHSFKDNWRYLPSKAFSADNLGHTTH